MRMRGIGKTSLHLVSRESVPVCLVDDRLTFPWSLEGSISKSRYFHRHLERSSVSGPFFVAPLRLTCVGLPVQSDLKRHTKDISDAE